MKLDDLKPGMVVACGNRDRIGDSGLWMAVVVQVGGWIRGRMGRPFQPGEWGADVAIATLDPDTEEWEPAVILPRVIVMPWAEYIEKNATVKSARALRRLKEEEAKQKLRGRTQAVLQRLEVLGIKGQGGFNPPMETSTEIGIDLDDLELLLSKLKGGTP